MTGLCLPLSIIHLVRTEDFLSSLDVQPLHDLHLALDGKRHYLLCKCNFCRLVFDKDTFNYEIQVYGICLLESVIPLLSFLLFELYI